MDNAIWILDNYSLGWHHRRGPLRPLNEQKDYPAHHEDHHLAHGDPGGRPPPRRRARARIGRHPPGPFASTRSNSCRKAPPSTRSPRWRQITFTNQGTSPATDIEFALESGSGYVLDSYNDVGSFAPGRRRSATASTTTIARRTASTWRCEKVKFADGHVGKTRHQPRCGRHYAGGHRGRLVLARLLAGETPRSRRAVTRR